MKILTIYFITFPMPSCFPKIPICNFSWLIIWLYSAAISFSVFHRQAKKKKKINSETMLYLTSAVP